MRIDGLGAFPLTPLADDELDERSLAAQISRLASSEVDSIAVLGSTGSGPYLTRAERARVIRIAVDEADGVPVFAGVGSPRTADVLAHIEDAERAGAAAVVVAAISYQPLSDAEVFGLFSDVASATELPVIVYDNPRTTGYTFSLDMYERVTALPGVASIKIPGVPADPDEAREHVQRIRARIPRDVTIGISGDAAAAAGIRAGCDAWFSVLAGTLPGAASDLFRAARADGGERADAGLRPLWDLYAEAGGGLRVMAAIAEQLRRATRSCLPRPLIGLDDEQRERLARVLDEGDLLPA